MRTRISLVLPALAVALVGLSRPALGNGFSLQDFDGHALGMSNAFAAEANNPSAEFYNPAGQSQLDGYQVEASLVYVQGFQHFDGDSSAESESNTKANPIFVPAFFATAELTDNLHAGLGIFEPFGLSIKWPRDWAGRYNVTTAQISVIEVNPNLSWKQPIGEANFITFAAGFSVDRTQLKLEQAVDLSAAGEADGFARESGDNDDRMNWRYDVAIHLSLFDKMLRLGAVYRSDIENVGIHGTAEFSTNGQVAPPGFPPAATHVFTRIDLPDQLRMGAAYMPIKDVLTLELDGTWTNWSKVDKIFLHFDDLGRVQRLNFGFNDSWFVALGADYKVVPDLLSLRAGIYYDETPVRLETRGPALPDADRKGFSLGIGITPAKFLSLDIAYLAVFFQNARKENTIGSDLVATGSPNGNGDYTTYGQVVTASVTLKFGAEDGK